jgi:hypothetical protein
VLIEGDEPLSGGHLLIFLLWANFCSQQPALEISSKNTNEVTGMLGEGHRL